MTSVHNEPHPLAQKYVRPSNVEIAKKFGIVRIEDWNDRIEGDSWLHLRSRGLTHVDRYTTLAQSLHAPLTGLACDEIVRCHMQSTGDLVLLHNDWLANAQVIA